VQTILYSNKILGKARKYKMRWVMEFPDEWLAYDKVSKHLRDMFEARNEVEGNCEIGNRSLT
jgi:hypothetical protein